MGSFIKLYELAQMWEDMASERHCATWAEGLTLYYECSGGDKGAEVRFRSEICGHDANDRVWLQSKICWDQSRCKGLWCCLLCRFFCFVFITVYMVMNRAHSFPRAVEFRAEPLNLPFFTEFWHICGILQKLRNDQRLVRSLAWWRNFITECDGKNSN